MHIAGAVGAVQGDGAHPTHFKSSFTRANIDGIEQRSGRALSIALYCTSPPAATFAFQIAEIAAVADAGSNKR